MTDEERRRFCDILRAYAGSGVCRAMEPRPCKRAADEIEQLNLELRNERDVRAEAERGCVSMAKEIKRLVEDKRQALSVCERLLAEKAALAQSDAEPIKWLPDANMRTELDRSELVARALLKEIMKQIDCIEAEGNIEWHKRIKLNGELYLPDLAVAVLAVLYTVLPRPDTSAGLIEAAEMAEQQATAIGGLEGWELQKFAKFLRARAADRSRK